MFVHKDIHTALFTPRIFQLAPVLNKHRGSESLQNVLSSKTFVLNKNLSCISTWGTIMLKFMSAPALQCATTVIIKQA